MRRYNVPRVAFINKLDRSGADPWRVINDLRYVLLSTSMRLLVAPSLTLVYFFLALVLSGHISIYTSGKLRHNVAAVQIPIGLEADLEGVVDLLEMKAYGFLGEKGMLVKEMDIPKELLVCGVDLVSVVVVRCCRA